MLLCLCLCSAVSVHGENIRLSDLFPFGPGEGDETVPSGNDIMVTVPLEAPVLFYGELRQSIVVSYNYRDIFICQVQLTVAALGLATVL